MPATYEPIATQTLGTAAASITFSSIPATYTDLRVVWVGTTATASTIVLQYNSDTATNYSFTFLSGTGTAANSTRTANNGSLYLSSQSPTSTTIPSMRTADIFSYAGSTFKTSLSSASSDFNGSGAVENSVGLWRSTAAITSVKIMAANGTTNFSIGTTATIYGIKAA